MLCHGFQNCSVLLQNNYCQIQLTFSSKKKHLSGYYRMSLNVVMTSVTWNHGYFWLFLKLRSGWSSFCRGFSVLLECECTSDSAAVLYSGTNEICQPLFQYLQVIASYLHKSLWVIKSYQFLKVNSGMLCLT